MHNYSIYSDHELAALFQKGDAIAYKEIYDRYWQLLFRFSRKLMQDSVIAEDIVQDVFATFWVKRELLDVDSPLASYLYKLTRNKVLDILRHSKVESRYIEKLQHVVQNGSQLPDQLYVERELYDQIEKEIKNLPEKMRIIFEMSRKDFKSNKEIADELGISQQTVKNQVSNAIRTLKGKLGDSINIFLIIF